MKSLQLKEGITWIGALDSELRVFDIIMHTEFGTTYNSYVVKGTEKTAVIETVKLKFWDQYLEKLKSQIDPEKIDYIVVNHTEPDHVGSAEKLLGIATNAKVVGSSTAIKFLKAIANRDFEYIIVNTGTEIQLGGKTLEFISAPFLHWPDSMYTYIKEDRTLFTCDSFGSHYAFDEILSSKITKHEDYMTALKYYYNMIMGPFKPYVLEAIKKIENIDIDMICPGHGPVLDENPRKIVEYYRQWSTEINPNTKKSVVVPYVSAYGYTAELAEEIRKGIATQSDIKVETFDMVYADKDEVISKMRWADGLLFGSPTINSDALPPIWDLVMGLSPIVHGGKFASAFGSYGWSGEAVPNLERRLSEARMKVVPGLKINFKPKAEELKSAYDFGVKFGECVMNNGNTLVNKITQNKKSHPDVDGTKKLWRCVICGEVYEGIEPPEICPACGASAEQFEVYVQKEVTFHSETKENIVIIGNNASGIAAAEAVSERNKNVNIRIIDKDPEYAYYRPMLSDYISGNYDEKNFYLHDIKWYAEKNITLTLGVAVTKVKPNEKCIVLENGEEIKYDKLILTNGSHNFIPPITDINKQGVFNIRSLKDAQNVKEYAAKSKDVVIIGAGLLGLEVASELKTLGLNVTAVEQVGRILPRQLDSEGSCMFELGMAKTGIKLVKGVGVTAILGNENVNGVQLSNGEMIKADMVIVSVGIRPNIELAIDAGINTNKGIVVDSEMKTNIENIYAAGDVAEFEGIDYGIWPEAVEQGKVAGANSVGDHIEYEHFIPSNVFNGMNMNVFSIGDIGLKEDVQYKCITHRDSEKIIYKKLVFVKNQLVGGILIGDVSKTACMIKGMNKGATSEEMVIDIILE